MIFFNASFSQQIIYYFRSENKRMYGVIPFVANFSFFYHHPTSLFLQSCTISTFVSINISWYASYYLEPSKSLQMLECQRNVVILSQVLSLNLVFCPSSFFLQTINTQILNEVSRICWSVLRRREIYYIASSCLQKVFCNGCCYHRPKYITWQVAKNVRRMLFWKHLRAIFEAYYIKQILQRFQ